jgi:glyceraldehyde-3-phosphate dehydrogenase/erythrose-4-phosphate dehydrogenase
MIGRHIQSLAYQIAHRLLNPAESRMVGMTFRVVIETLAKCLQLKRIPSDERRFEGVNDVLDARVIPTMGSLANTDRAIVSMDFNEEPITAVIYLNDFSFYVCDF